MPGSPDSSDTQRLEWLRRLRREAMANRAAILSEVGPDGRTPLISVRVIEQEGGERRHASAEGVATWTEPERLHLARFKRPAGQPDEEVCVNEEDALRWGFALGWGEA